MLRWICVLWGLILAINLIGMELPFSDQPIQTEENLFTGFVRVDPDDSIPEKLNTRSWLWYDEEALYVHFTADIDSNFVQGMFAGRDSGSDSDYLRVQLITIPEAYYAYYYCAYPSGSLLDGIRKDQGGVDYSWNSDYSYETSYDEKLWKVTLRFPFKDLRFDAKPPYDWKIILTRYHEKSEEFYSKPYANTKMGKDYFTKALDITLTHKIKRSSDWKFKPYMVKSYDLVNQTDTFDPEHVGMDISFSPSTRTKLKIALNPDFSDVPPDNAQDDYNSIYPPWYSENRFFFTEDIDAFGMDYGVFYSRNIAQPQIAAKFTGNSKTWNYGYLCAKDKKIVDHGYVVNNDDFYQMGSLIKTMPRLKTVVSGISRINDGYYNHIAVGYWKWEFIKELYIGSSHMFAFRHTDHPDTLSAEKADYQGNFTKAFISADPGNWDIELNYTNTQKDLKVDTGMFWETGYENYSFDLSWDADTKEKYLKGWGFSNGVSYSDRLDAVRSFYSANAWSNAWLSFQPKYSISFSANSSREAWQGSEYDKYNVYGNFTWNRWESFGFYTGSSYGKSLIYALSSTYNRLSPNIYFWGSIGNNLSWSANLSHVQYDYDRVTYIQQDTLQVPVTLDNSYQIGSASLRYSFNNDMILSNGFSLTNYDTDGDYARISFYSNFRYEFKKDWFLYLGYKTGQAQDQNSDWKDPVGHFVRNSASAYLKLSATL